MEYRQKLKYIIYKKQLRIAITVAHKQHCYKICEVVESTQ